MPVQLNCTVMASAHSKYHKLLWIKGDVFVQSGDLHYSMWSSQFDNDTNTQNHYLVVRQVVNPAKFTCELLSINGKVIDSKTHYIYVIKGKHFSLD